MTTTAEAAATAGVTTDTIRTWCRYGAIAAVKAAGRWVIDATSLARRITIGQRTRPTTTPAPAPVETPLHMQKDACMYERHQNQWTVRLKGRVLRSALRAAKGTGDPVRVLVTKRTGSTKEQTLTTRAWKTMRGPTADESTFNAELPAAERGDRSGECAECLAWSRDLTPLPDASGIVLPICHGCSYTSSDVRSYC